MIIIFFSHINSIFRQKIFILIVKNIGKTVDKKNYMLYNM
jgi:hypothetical protein